MGQRSTILIQKKKKKKEIKIREKINRGRQAMLKRSKVMASEKNEEGVKVWIETSVSEMKK